MQENLSNSVQAHIEKLRVLRETGSIPGDPKTDLADRLMRVIDQELGSCNSARDRGLVTGMLLFRLDKKLTEISDEIGLQ